MPAPAAEPCRFRHVDALRVSIVGNLHVRPTSALEARENGRTLRSKGRQMRMDSTIQSG